MADHEVVDEVVLSGEWPYERIDPVLPPPSSGEIWSTPAPSEGHTCRPRAGHAHGRTDDIFDPGRIREALGTVLDPEIGRPITELGMVDSIEQSPSGELKITILLTIAGCPMRETIGQQVQHAAQGASNGASVQVVFRTMSDSQRQELQKQLRGPRRGIPFNEPTSYTKIYAVTSGKGGVGKSSVTVNLACAASAQGLRVGIVDADVFGFSVPQMMGVNQSPTRLEGMILPPSAHGVKVISVGMFVSNNEPVVWRGPRLHRILEQFLTDVYFGDLDVLFLDLPPGTGDVAMSVAQLLPGAEILVVTTPQAAAAGVAERSGALALKTGQKVAGVIENMSYFELPDGTVIEPFGSGGGSAVAKRLTDILGTEIGVLGSIPLEVSVREGGDAGQPIVVQPNKGTAASVFRSIARQIAMQPRGLAGKSLGIRPR